MTIDQELLLPAAEYNRPAGALVMVQALDRGLDFDAVFCFNDLLAHGALRTLLSRSRAVPEDVAMIGIDNIEEDRFSTPSMSSIGPGKAEIARIAGDVLLSRIDGATDRPDNSRSRSALWPEKVRPAESDRTVLIPDLVGSGSRPGR